MTVGPVELRGSIVRLEPLTIKHVGDLTEAASHDQVWAYLDEETPADEEPVAALIQEARAEQQRGERLAFAIVDVTSDKAVGSISYIDISPSHHSLEIGWAWLAPSYWRTGAIREASHLLMRHAFNDLGAIRVAFKTDSRNTRSQQAIKGLGATEEGTFRNHRILRDGHIRHSIYYSVTAEDWPAVSRKLEADRAARGAPALG
ncbi:GNAT family protein [Micromonospora ureilytica]|uniref:GNAT family N-acetyltransferase n=1 Tax=Micromonospora ureilytica TaxID=709868 RepID=UPI002E159E9B|nr:GNAT family N-acetyltransferase [Micromonospora ureilytica]